jgi:AraC-like DNA-binding protein
MLDLTRLPILTPEALLGSEPPLPPPGPVHLALPGWPERQQPTVLYECFARLGLGYLDSLPDAPYHIDLAMNPLPGLFMAAGKLAGSHMRRTRKRIEAGAEEVALLINLNAPYRIEQRGKEVVLGHGEAAFVSAADPSVFTHKPPGDVLALQFPKDRFAQLLLDPDACYMRRIPRDTQALRFLTGYVAAAWDEPPTASTELKHLMVTHIHDLMGVIAGATRDAGQAARDGGLRAARLNAIKQDIATSLDRSDLSIAVLAARHRFTPRHVQRLFEREGTTFTEYVLAQRLARAHRLLADPRRAGEKISALAYDCGFGDVSYFNRAFRRHFGAAPSDLRAARKRGDSI